MTAPKIRDLPANWRCEGQMTIEEALAEVDDPESEPKEEQ